VQVPARRVLETAVPRNATGTVKRLRRVPAEILQSTRCPAGASIALSPGNTGRFESVGASRRSCFSNSAPVGEFQAGTGLTVARGGEHRARVACRAARSREMVSRSCGPAPGRTCRRRASKSSAKTAVRLETVAEHDIVHRLARTRIWVKARDEPQSATPRGERHAVVRLKPAPRAFWRERRATAGRAKRVLWSGASLAARAISSETHSGGWPLASSGLAALARTVASANGVSQWSGRTPCSRASAATDTKDDRRCRWSSRRRKTTHHNRHRAVATPRSSRAQTSFFSNLITPKAYHPRPPKKRHGIFGRPTVSRHPTHSQHERWTFRSIPKREQFRNNPCSGAPKPQRFSTYDCCTD
jgi:hypothetical protein